MVKRKKRKPLTRDYTLHSHTLEQVTSAKYLGVTITSDMKWNTHIANMCQKANNTLSFLKRNLNIGNPNIKGMAYKSLVRPILEYACTTWDPYQQNNIYKMEMVQRRAARYTKNYYGYRDTDSVTTIIRDLKWESLEERRRKARLGIFFKIENKLVNVDATDKMIIPKRRSRHMHF